MVTVMRVTVRREIVYGPPDEFEMSEPRPGDAAPPAAEWYNRAVSGDPATVKFVDRCNCGDYKLQTSGNQ